MVDPVKDEPSKIQPKCRHQRRRSKSRRGKDSNIGTGENNTPDDAEDNEDPIEITSEQEDVKKGKLALMNRP